MEKLNIKISKKVIYSSIIITTVLSAILYNFLYKNKEKIEIFEEEDNIPLNEDIEEKETTICVDVGGEVKNPGLYELPENARINDAISIAGGITEEADLTDVNLAYILQDALKITIPKKEALTNKIPIISSSISSKVDVSKVSGYININTASIEELKNLTGIGESTAQKIIDYRNEKGKYKSIEEIKEVSGIGDSKYEKIKNKIIV